MTANFSSPFIFDSDMQAGLPESDFEFFDAALPQESALSGTGLLEDNLLDSPLNHSSPRTFAAHHYASSDPHSGKQQPSASILSPPPVLGSRLSLDGRSEGFSNPSSASPESSSQDSSSDSSRSNIALHRKSSGNSSHSGLTGLDVTMTEDWNLNEWKTDDLMMGGDGPALGTEYTLQGPTTTGMDTGLDLSNNDSSAYFDFDSAASSPLGGGSDALVDPRQPQPSTVQGSRKPSPSQQKLRRKGGIDGKNIRAKFEANLGNSATTGSLPFQETASLGLSPSSTAMASQETSPTATFHSTSPQARNGYAANPMLTTFAQNTVWDPTTGFNDKTYSNCISPSGLTTSTNTSSLASPFMPSKEEARNANVPAMLTIGPTPLKSRVETQIPIRMSLFPMPAGVTKLRLPTHTISKPKLLAKPPVPKSPDMLELHTMLVCTSAMQVPGNLERAFARAQEAEDGSQNDAASNPSSESSRSATSESDEDNKPLNGGEVKICNGCIMRERKRAARKKMKKIEEEESWSRDEGKRVIVFNTQEIKDWQAPPSESGMESPRDRMSPVQEGCMQVEAPMRIACYCRHQNEKMGFQVIFTIKDHLDKVIAQTITQSIMITDDHKTHTPVTAFTAQASMASDTLPPGSGHMPFSTNGLPRQSGAITSFDFQQQDPSLQNMSTAFSHQFATPQMTSASQSTATSPTPRNLSRQASFSGLSGPSAKKRKQSGSGKVPTGLAMTRLETSPFETNSNITSAGPSTRAPSTSTSPFSHALSSFGTSEQRQPGSRIPPQFSTGPPTPNSQDNGFFTQGHRSQSMENLPMVPVFSAPTSAHQSRSGSPTGGARNAAAAYQQAQQVQQAQIVQAVANGLYGMPLAFNPQRPPTIHKLIPNEGPKNGGIEVTCLGSGFCQGLEVMFGDFKATTTTFWGDTSIVCLLPPSPHAGTVPVTFKHQHQQIQQFPNLPVPKQNVLFKYVDDEEQQLLRTALTVVGHKMTGKMEDARDIAMRIVGNHSSPWGAVGGSSGHTGGQQRQVNGLHASALGIVDLETALLKCLDLIDLDDSTHQPRLNLKRSTGHTMLHLACSLGMHRFVAALLARGANPTPRDKGGFTPMHLAAIRNHPEIVRRLILNGADPTMRSLQGYTPADLASSEEVLRSIRRVEHHSRQRSGGNISQKTKTSSATSLRSLWEPPSDLPRVLSRLSGYEFESSSSELEDDQSDGVDETDSLAPAIDTEQLWMRSRRNSGHIATAAGNTLPTTAPQELPAHRLASLAAGLPSPAAAVSAWRDQLTAHLQNLQNLHWNLPILTNLPQMPAFPPIPNLPDYQSYLPNPMARINSLVPSRNHSQNGMKSRPGSSDSQERRAEDYRWWELFSMPSPPPAYEDIFPSHDAGKVEEKTTSAFIAAADTVADAKCTKLFDHTAKQTTLRSSAEYTATTAISRTIANQSITREEQEELRAAHARKLKKIESDRKLFLIWIPLLVLIMVAIVFNRGPQVLSWFSEIPAAFNLREERRVVEVL